MQLRPEDGGPIYAETDLSAFIAEPWNALSSLAILLPAVYWAIKLKGDFRNYSFIFYCIPLLFLGGLGSTLFHAFRASRWFLMMDILPTAILTLSVSIYFWHKILPKVWQVPAIVIPLIFVRMMVFQSLPAPASINTGYFVTGVMIFFPIIIHLIKTSFLDIRDIAISVLCLVLALFFRERDHGLSEWLPMGSHFIWHLLSGIGAFFLAKYLYQIRWYEINNKTTA